MKVTVAMSGGVDSSVAVTLLQKEGHQVTGVTMRLFSTCDSAGDNIDKAREVAEKLGITHHTLDLEDTFRATVVSEFCEEYSRGRTPNPCVVCNRYIKFGILMDKVRELGAEYLATGHYARIERDTNSGKYLLRKGIDISKDQSYFLYRLDQEQLSHTLFPVGGITKDEVRSIAREMELPVTDRPESQEICFIPSGNYTKFLEENLTEPGISGPIVSESGEKLGEHRGIYSYTIGQRRGMGISSTEPLYVTDIKPETQTIIVGRRDSLYSKELIASNLSWISGEPPEYPTRLNARIRYRHPEAAATISPVDDDTIKVMFDEPQMAITPGQSVVFYEGDRVIGGGQIVKPGKDNG